MEEALQRQMQEVIKVRAEYNGLFEKLTLSNRLFNEKDREYKATIAEQVARIDTLTTQNENLSKDLRSLKKTEESRKKKFVQDTQQIAEIYEKLESKEYDMEMKFQKYKDDLATAARELHLKNCKVDSLEKEITSLHFRLTNDSVPLSKHKEATEEASTTIADLRRKISNDLISIVEYRNMVVVNEKLTKRIEDECVPLEEFKKLQGFLKVALSEKKLIEESVAVIEETKANAVEQSKIIQHKQALFDEKLERTEKDLADERRSNEKLLTQMHQLQSDLNSAQDANNELKEQCNQLEKIKISCMIQIGNAKQSARNEIESKRGAVEQQARLKEEFRALQANNQQLQSYTVHLSKEVAQLKEEREESTSESLKVLQEKESLLKEFEQLFVLLQEKCDTISDLEDQMKVFKEAVADEILHQFNGHNHPERIDSEEEVQAEQLRRETLREEVRAPRESPRTSQLNYQHRQTFRESQDSVVGSSQEWLENHRNSVTQSLAPLTPLEASDVAHPSSTMGNGTGATGIPPPYASTKPHSLSQSQSQVQREEFSASYNRPLFNSSTNAASRAVTGTSSSSNIAFNTGGPNSSSNNMYASNSSRFKLNVSPPDRNSSRFKLNVSPPDRNSNREPLTTGSLSSASWKQRPLVGSSDAAAPALPEPLQMSELQPPDQSMSPLHHPPPPLPQTIYPSSFDEKNLPSSVYPPTQLPFANSGSGGLLGLGSRSSSRNSSPAKERPTGFSSSSTLHNGVHVGPEYRGVRLSTARYEETRDSDPCEEALDLGGTGSKHTSLGSSLRKSHNGSASVAERTIVPAPDSERREDAPAPIPAPTPTSVPDPTDQPSPGRADRMAQLVATKDKLKGLESKIRMLSQRYEAETAAANTQ